MKIEWSPRRAGLALNDLAVLPAVALRARPLLARRWELRANLTPYAAYAALAEALEATLLTGDQRLARASGPRSGLTGGQRLARASGPRCRIVIFQPVR